MGRQFAVQLQEHQAAVPVSAHLNYYFYQIKKIAQKREKNRRIIAATKKLGTAICKIMTNKNKFCTAVIVFCWSFADNCFLTFLFILSILVYVSRHPDIPFLTEQNLKIFIFSIFIAHHLVIFRGFLAQGSNKSIKKINKLIYMNTRTACQCHILQKSILYSQCQVPLYNLL